MVQVFRADVGAAPHMRALAEDPMELPEVVVSAPRRQPRVEDSPASVSVISGDEITQRNLGMVADALRGTPGVDLTEFGSVGQSSFATIRGATADQVKFQLDGVEVNTTTAGQFDFANLTSANTDRIDVVRGGAGALYSCEAIGGLIDVHTRRGEGPFHLLSGGEAGSAATHHEELGINGATGPFALSGTASFLASDGFRSINDDYRNFSTVWRGDLDVVPNGTLRTFLRYIESRKGLANYTVVENRLDTDARARDNFFLAKGEWEHAPTDLVNYRATVSFVRDNPRFGDDTVENVALDPIALSHTPGEQIQTAVQANCRWPQFALSTLGVEYTEQWAEFNEVVDAVTEPVIRQNRSIVSAYGQEELLLLDDALRAAGGMRFTGYDVYGDHGTFSGSGSYRVRPTQTILHVGYNESFRAPAFDELFGVQGDTTLQSEHGWEINAGLTQDLWHGLLRFEPTYFFGEVHELIEDIAELPPVGAGPPGAQTHNVPVARMEGVELLTNLQPTHWFTLTASYTYLNFASTQALLNRPRHRGSVIAAGQWDSAVSAGDHTSVAVTVHAVGRRNSPNPYNSADPFSPAPIGSYARVDLAMAYRFAGPLSPLSLTASVRNLLNRDYPVHWFSRAARQLPCRVPLRILIPEAKRVRRFSKTVVSQFDFWAHLERVSVHAKVGGVDMVRWIYGKAFAGFFGGLAIAFAGYAADSESVTRVGTIIFLVSMPILFVTIRLLPRR
jgi:vitamin B12 transporter